MQQPTATARGEGVKLQTCQPPVCSQNERAARRSARRYPARILAATHRDNFGDDRNGNFVGRDGAKIQPCWRLQLRQSLGGYSFGKFRLEHVGLAPAADEGDVIRVDRERRK